MSANQPEPCHAKPSLDLERAFGLSDIGPVRSTNEDNFLIEPALGLVAVADGMGGHAGGALASARVLAALASWLDGHRANQHLGGVDRVRPSPPDPERTWTGETLHALDVLREAVCHANEELYQANVADGRGDGGGMGTTLTGLWQPEPGGPILAVQVGDSRLYRLRGGHLEQLTRDQTLYQQALDAGYTRDLPPRNLLLQAVGPAQCFEPALQMHRALPGDLYLLCSDGLHGVAGDDAIAATLAAADASTLSRACAELIALAHRSGTRDNITAVLVPGVVGGA